MNHAEGLHFSAFHYVLFFSSESLLFSVFYSEGIDFLNHHPGLGDNCCFIAMEAVTWLLDKVSGLTTRGDAIKILQVGTN